MRLAQHDYMTWGYQSRAAVQKRMVKEPQDVFIAADHAGHTIRFGMHEDLYGAHISPAGALHIHTSGDAKPNIRAKYAQLFGVGCGRASEFAKQLVCPHTCKVISVARIEGNPVLWVDYEHGIAMLSGSIMYASPTARPIRTGSGSHVIKYGVANRERAVEGEAHIKRLVAEATFRRALVRNVNMYSYSGYSVCVEALNAALRRATNDTCLEDVTNAAFNCVATLDEKLALVGEYMIRTKFDTSKLFEDRYTAETLQVYK